MKSPENNLRRARKFVKKENIDMQRMTIEKKSTFQAKICSTERATHIGARIASESILPNFRKNILPQHKTSRNRMSSSPITEFSMNSILSEFVLIFNK